MLETGPGLAGEAAAKGKESVVEMSIAENALELIGHTPMVRLRKVVGQGAAEVIGKLESYNPGGSVKDRIARRMIEEAERSGRLKPGGTIVEPTSGNTGIGLAVVAAVKGYRLILTMPDDMSVERRALLSLYGAELVLTPAIEGMAGAVREAKALAEKHGYYMPQQFENPANPQAHRETTAPEILEATGGKLDALVAGVGTGGTLTGIAEVLKREKPGIWVTAVEPANSAVLSGGTAGWHRLQGLGAGFVPAVLNREVIDEVIPVADREAYEMVSRLAREEGLLVGPSSGAAVFAACRVAARLGAGHTVVVILPDSGERYLSLLQSMEAR